MDVGLKHVSVIASRTKKAKTRGLFKWLTYLTGDLFTYVNVYLYVPATIRRFRVRGRTAGLLLPCCEISKISFAYLPLLHVQSWDFRKPFAPQGCECTALSAHCRGDNNSWVNAVNNLPSATEHFTFTIFSGRVHRKVQIDLSANLGRLQNLTEFRINTQGDDLEQDYQPKGTNRTNSFL